MSTPAYYPFFREGDWIKYPTKLCPTTNLPCDRGCEERCQAPSLQGKLRADLKKEVPK